MNISYRNLPFLDISQQLEGKKTVYLPTGESFPIRPYIKAAIAHETWSKTRSRYDAIFSTVKNYSEKLLLFRCKEMRYRKKFRCNNAHSFE